MVAIDQIEQRLTAVEQILAGGDHDFKDISEIAGAIDRIDNLESRIDDIETRIATIEGRTESVEAYVGNIESVNEDIGHQADMAIASVDRLERRIVEIEQLMDVSTVERVNNRLDRFEKELRRLSAQQSGGDGEDEFGALAFEGETQDENSSRTASQTSETGGT